MSCASLAVLAFLVFSPSVRAQEESSSKPKEAKQGQAQSVRTATSQPDVVEAGESSSQPSTNSTATTPEPVVRSIGRGGALGTSRGPLHWGPVGVRSAAITQYFDHVNLSGGSFDEWVKTTVFETNIVYDHRSRRSRLAIQYQPQLTIVNGRVLGNYSNQDLSLDTYYYLSSRWNMNINDSFRHSGNRNFYTGGTFFDSDLATGAVARNNFLGSPNQLISNTTTVTLTYRLSQRTSLSLAPDFSYTHTGGSDRLTPGFNSVPNSAYSYGGSVNVDRSLDARSSVGAFYSAHRSSFSRSFSNTIYHTAGGHYGRQLTPSIHFDATLGYTRAFLADGRQENSWYADTAVSKRFKRSSVSLAYIRGQTSSNTLLSSVNFITNRFVDRVDVAYSVELTRRVSLGTSVGHLRETGSEPGISGTYVSTYLGYRLRPSVSLIGQYAHRNQAGQAPQVLSGHGDFFSFGLRWAPPSAEPY